MPLLSRKGILAWANQPEPEAPEEEDFRAEPCVDLGPEPQLGRDSSKSDLLSRWHGMPQLKGGSHVGHPFS